MIIIVILFIWGVFAAVLLVCPNLKCPSETETQSVNATSNETNLTTDNKAPRDAFFH